MTDFILIDLSDINDDAKMPEIHKLWNSLNIPVPTNDVRNSSPFLKNICTLSEGNHYITSIYLMKLYNTAQKIWINPKNGYVIVYEDKEGYKFSEHFIEHLNNIESVIIPKEKKWLDINIILEKISNSGVNSLTKEEKDYLDSHTT